MLSRISVVLSGVVLACGCLTEHSYAAFSMDDASAAAYNDGWQTGDDGDGAGGFGPWTLTFSSPGNGSVNGAFVGSSTANADGSDNGNVGGVANDGDIDTAGRAWALYANSGNDALARRTLPSSMQVGDTLTVDMDNGFVDNGGLVTVTLINQNNVGRMTIHFIGGTAQYGAIGDSFVGFGVGYGDEGLNISMTMIDPETIRATLTRRDGVTDTQDVQLLGLTQTGTGISQIQVGNFFAGPDSPRNAYFNSMTFNHPDAGVVPEAGMFLVWGLVMMTVGLVTKRQRA